jgi:predicted DNA-binding transcriptional regulator AlpA
MNPEVLPIITEAEACEITAQLRLGPEPAKSQKQLAAKALAMKKRAPAAQPSPPPPPPAKGGGTDEIYEQILRDGDPPLGLRVLRFPELKTRKGIDYARQYVDRLEREGRFPTRLRLGPNSVGWLEHEIDDWIAALPRGRIRDRRVERARVGLKRGGAKRDKSDK